MRVLVHCDWPGHGAAPTTLQLAASLVRAGLTSVLAVSEPGYADEQARSIVTSGAVQHIAVSGFFEPDVRERDYRQYAALVHDYEPDIVHCQGFSEVVRLRSICGWLSRKPLIVLTDRSSPRWFTKRGYLSRIAALHALRCEYIALNRAQEAKVRMWPILRPRVHHIPNGVEVLGPHIGRKGVVSSRISIVMPASLYPGKGHLDVLRAVSRMKERVPRREVCLVLAGEGPLRHQIRAEAERLGLSQCVSMPGRLPRAELMRLYRGSHLGVFPSLMEMMPNAVLEMQSSGVPVVAYNIPGVYDIIRDGETGFLVNPGDVASFASRLGDLVEEASLRDEMSASAVNLVEQEFSWDVIGPRLRLLYEQILAAR